MKEFRKNIILLPADYNGVNNQKGILTADCNEKNIKCTIKCFNFRQTDEEFVLGIMINEDVFKTKVKASELSNLTYVVPCKAKMGDKISCTLLNVRRSDYDIVLWGSTETTRAWQNACVCRLEDQMLEDGSLKTELKFNSLHQQNIKQNIEVLNQEEQETKDSIIDFEYEKEQQLVEEYIDKIFNLTEPSEQVEEVESISKSEEEFDSKKEFEKYQSKIFFERVESQVNNLLNKNEKDGLLEDIIPNGRFCKVNLEDGHYVFGVIYEEDKPRYLCYGVPGVGGTNPPKELEGFCQWLPIDLENVEGEGYYISYQDAFSGENIKVEVIS